LKTRFLHKLSTWLLLCLLASAWACGGDTPSPPEEGSLLIINRSQYTLEELRIHEEVSYLKSNNVLTKSMAVGENYVFHGAGWWNVTVFREKFNDGPLIAVTTANPIEMLGRQGQELQVFDESFRLSVSEWVQSSTMTMTASTSTSGLSFGD
jgi:hypothetical protein